MTTNSETRALNTKYPKGTKIEWFVDEGALRTGKVIKATGGKLLITSPATISRKLSKKVTCLSLIRKRYKIKGTQVKCLL